MGIGSAAFAHGETDVQGFERGEDGEKGRRVGERGGKGCGRDVEEDDEVCGVRRKTACGAVRWRWRRCIVVPNETFRKYLETQ